MILNTVTTMTSLSCLLTASKRSNAYLKTVRMFLDKKNEKKKVVVDAFLPANTARDAIQYSMDLYAQYVLQSLRQWSVPFDLYRQNIVSYCICTNCKVGVESLFTKMECYGAGYDFQLLTCGIV